MSIETPRHEKEELLVDWVEGALSREGPIRVDVLHFGTKSIFYQEGYDWFFDVIESSDRFSIDAENRVHLNGGD